jgi:hypothetical protein
VYVVPLLAGQSERGVYVGVAATNVVGLVATAVVVVVVDEGAADDVWLSRSQYKPYTLRPITL